MAPAPFMEHQKLSLYYWHIHSHTQTHGRNRTTQLTWADILQLDSMKLSLGTLQFRICSRHQKPSQLPVKPAGPILKTNIINPIIIYIPVHLQTPTRKLWGSPWPCRSEPRDQDLRQANVSRLLLFQGWNLRKPATGTVWSATGQHWKNVPHPTCSGQATASHSFEKKKTL